MTLLLASAAVASSGPAGDPAASPDRYLGLPLAEALALLQAEGLPLLFSSALVQPSMVVEAPPRGTDPEALLVDMLRPHGLGITRGVKGRLVVVRLEEAANPDRPELLPVTVERVVVTSPREESLHGEPVDAFEVDIQGIHHDLPHIGDDVFRAAGLAPGAETSEVSSRVSVRGSRHADVLVMLDGLELLEPYHLPEFDHALGIVSADSLERVEVLADPFPVEYGDRLGGVLDMTTRTPTGPLGLSLTVGSVLAEATGGGTFADGRGGWLATGRGGNYRVALEAEGRHEDPRYWDAFAKLSYEATPRQSLQIRTLLAEDHFAAAAESIGGGEYRSRWASSYLWLTHLAALGPNTTTETLAWAGRLERVRTAVAAVDGGSAFDLDDERDVDIGGLKTSLRLALPETPWSFDVGADLREFDASTEYLVHRRSSTAGDAGPGGAETVDFGREYDFDQSGFFASARAKWSPSLTLEGGLRYDDIGLTSESHLSPRFHAAWRPDAASVVRLGWGWYYQSQRPYELQVEDGETEVWPAERSEQRMLSYERRLPGGVDWRVGVFQRILRDPRPRFESLFDSAALYPELAPGRVRLEPDRGRGAGLELSISGTSGARLGWAAAYTLSEVADRIDGRWVPRATDQTHALQLDARYRWGRGWSLGAVWIGHTGWPTTRVLAADGGTGNGAETVLGPIRAERLSPYHRLDLRLGKSWQLARGRLSAYLDLQNAYGRANARGATDFAVAPGPDGTPIVTSEDVSWGGLTPSLVVRWQL